MLTSWSLLYCYSRLSHKETTFFVGGGENMIFLVISLFIAPLAVSILAECFAYWLQKRDK